MADQTNRIILQGVDNTGPATTSAKQNLTSLGATAEISAKQAAAAMRMVPAQMTDIVVSLASGQKPLTVLLQQGGQLKDMFGGVVPAAKALGAYLLALVNPVTIVAGALGVLVVAYAKASQQSEELNRVLIMTGGYAGQTADALNDMAKAMSAGGRVTRGDAVDALVEVIATGKVASTQLQGVAQAALDWSKVTGDSVKTVVARFTELADEPTKASAKLNAQYHFLTESVYAQIAALEEQGKKEQAAALAEKALAEAGDARVRQVTQSLGVFARAWDTVAKAAKGALNNIAGVVGTRTDSEQLEWLKTQQVNRAAWAKANPKEVDESWRLGDAKLAARIAMFDQLNQAQVDTAKSAGDAQRAQDAAIGADDRVRKLEEQAKGISAVDRELKKYRDDLASIRKVDPNSALLDPKAVKSTEADIRKRFAGPAPEQGIDAGIKRLQGALQSEERATKMSLDQISADYALGLTTTKQYFQQEYEARQESLERQIGIAKQQETLARGKSNVAAVEQYKNEQKKLQDEIEANFIQHATATTALTAKQQLAIAEHARGLTLDLRSRQGAIDDSLSGAGLSARERDQQQRMRDVQRAFDSKQEDLKHQLDLGEGRGGISQETYDKELADEQAFYQQRLLQEADFNAKSQVQRGDWTMGAKQAFAEYADSARDAAGQSAKFFGDVLQGMEDGLVQLATTGKLNFKAMANSIIGDIIRMDAKAELSRLFGPGTSGAGILQQIGSGIFGAKSAGGASGSFFDAGTAFLSAAAKGNVYASRDLAAYSNRIIDRPTLFAFARGAGLMGEAGPEAVMPLRRGADGRLGVAAGAGGTGGNITIVNPPGTKVDSVVDQRQPNGDRVIIQQLVGQIRDPNSKVSRALQTSFSAIRPKR